MESRILAKTVDFWSQRYGRTITNEEAVRIIEQFSSLFRALKDEAERIDGAMPTNKREVTL